MKVIFKADQQYITKNYKSTLGIAENIALTRQASHPHTSNDGENRKLYPADELAKVNTYILEIIAELV